MPEAMNLTRERVLDVVSFVARFGMAFVWIYGGVTKLGRHMEVTQSIQAYQIFDPAWNDLLARVIGPLELGGGLFLLVGLWLPQASKLANVVLLLFIVGISQAWLRGLELECGCFGGASGEVSNYAAEYAEVIVRDIVFIALHTWTIYRPFTRWAVRP